MGLSVGLFKAQADDLMNGAEVMVNKGYAPASSQ